MSKQGSLGGHSSTGHRLSNADFIDAHYTACRNMYETMLRAVGIQPGWSVLDAGCGSGGFLPLMAELVGSRGKIDAYDLAPENIERVKTLTADWDIPIRTEIGDLTALPYEDNTFDAIWNANVSQYLSDDALTQMLNEFVRVIKPGGVVAIKEHDATTLQFYPLDTFAHWRLIERNPNMYHWVRRSFNLPKWLAWPILSLRHFWKNFTLRSKTSNITLCQAPCDSLPARLKNLVYLSPTWNNGVAV